MDWAQAREQIYSRILSSSVMEANVLSRRRAVDVVRVVSLGRKPFNRKLPQSKLHSGVEKGLRDGTSEPINNSLDDRG